MLKRVEAEPEDQLAVFSDATWTRIKAHGRFLAADANDLILEYGQTNQDLMIILQGKTTLAYVQDGKTVPTAIYRTEGEVLHHAGMHLQIPNPFQIFAVDPGTRVVMINRDDVYRLISKDVAFAEFLFKDLSERFMTALGYLREQRQDPLIIRLAKRLLTITKHSPAVQFTQAELAEILAVTRISISKAIKALEEQGLVQRVERSRISVNREALQTWLKQQLETNVS